MKRAPDLRRFLPAFELAERIAVRHGVRVEALLGTDRLGPVAAARFEFWCVLHGTFGIPFAEIGRIVGRDHTTVIDGITKHETGLRKRDHRFIAKTRTTPVTLRRVS